MNVYARVSELVYETDLKSVARMGLGDRSPPRAPNIGVSSSGKTQDFDSCIRVFKSHHPSHAKQSSIEKLYVA